MSSSASRKRFVELEHKLSVTNKVVDDLCNRMDRMVREWVSPPTHIVRAHQYEVGLGSEQHGSVVRKIETRHNGLPLGYVFADEESAQTYEDRATLLRIVRSLKALLKKMEDRSQ